LAKDRLFTAASEADTLKKVRDCQIPSLRKVNPLVHADLEKICNKALLKDKGHRYQTAGQLYRDLNRFLNTHYPDFSAQDFSKSMKSLFNQTYLDNRRKFAEFMKAQLEEDDSTVVTQTSTLTSNTSEDKNSEGSLVAADGNSVSIDALRNEPNTNSKSLIKQKLFNQQTKSQGLNRSVGQTQTGFVIKRTSSPAWMDWGLNAAIGAVVVGIGLFFFKGQLFGTNEPYPEVAYQPQQAIVQPSKARVPMNIQSEPSKASVYINGERKGITPYRGSIEAGVEFSLTLSLDEYLPYDRYKEVAPVEGYTLRATLQPKPPMGYISIDVVPSSPETIIYVNNQRLLEKPPVRRYQIAAGLPMKIRAVNPYSKLSAETEITVGVGQKRAVQLNLK
jgi:serine/threonine-protein kinase